MLKSSVPGSMQVMPADPECAIAHVEGTVSVVTPFGCIIAGSVLP